MGKPQPTAGITCFHVHRPAHMVTKGGTSLEPARRSRVDRSARPQIDWLRLAAWGMPGPGGVRSIAPCRTLHMAISDVGEVDYDGGRPALWQGAQQPLATNLPSQRASTFKCSRIAKHMSTQIRSNPDRGLCTSTSMCECIRGLLTGSRRQHTWC